MWIETWKLAISLQKSIFLFPVDADIAKSSNMISTFDSLVYTLAHANSAKIQRNKSFKSVAQLETMPMRNHPAHLRGFNFRAAIS